MFDKKFYLKLLMSFLLVALSVLSPHDDNCRRAIECLPLLEGCQVHSTVMLSEVDKKIFRKLGIGLTCDPVRKKL